MIRRVWCWLWHGLIMMGGRHLTYDATGCDHGHGASRFLGCCRCKSGKFAEKS
jgi:hypothetical protein